MSDRTRNAGRRLLVHHHAVAHESGGKIWVQSFLGAWIGELARHFDEVGLLLHTSAERLPQQDVAIGADNVRLHSLGPTAHGAGRGERNRRIRMACWQTAHGYDVLLIRGITPRQMLVYRECSVPRKAFLMVGSIRDSRPKLRLSARAAFAWGMHRLRMRELRTIARGSVMMANSPRTVEELRREFGIEAAFVPTNTISSRDFGELKTGPFQAPPRLLFCGRVVRDKGVEELIDALGMLKAQGLECTLELVGSVSDAYRRELEGLAGSRSVKEQIRFRGFVAFGEALLELYRAADLYVLPSWHEGFPHSIWEAAASGTPMVVTRVGGIPGVISEEEASLVRPREPAELAAAIGRMLRDPAGARAKAERAYSLAASYTVERCAETAAELLAGVPTRPETVPSYSK